MFKSKSRRKVIKNYQKQSFDARLQMEKDAQKDLNARLKVIELNLKNIGRI